MKNIFVYCETEDGVVADVSLELLSKARKLADQLQVQVAALLFGNGVQALAEQLFPYGADIVYLADDARLAPFTTLPHTRLVEHLIATHQPQIVLFGASSVGRDLAPRVASACRCGLTADCTSLEIGDHEEKKTNTTYRNLLYQIRPAFGGNIIATIINPDMHPQMATVREGVMKKEIFDPMHRGTIEPMDLKALLTDELFVLQIVERHMEKSKVNMKGAPVVVAGGYGVGSKENFAHLFELASVLGGEVGASRAAVDAGFADHERQIGQTGLTVRPKLYIACGISGAVQHRAGMEESAMIISINTDANAPINKIADYVIKGDVAEVVPRMIKYYKANSK